MYHRKTNIFTYIPIIIICSVLTFAIIASLCIEAGFWQPALFATEKKGERDFIKWVDFNASYGAMEKAMELDIDSYGSEVHLDWIEMLAYLACKYGNNFKQYKASDLNELAEKLRSGETMNALTEKMKYYDYYKECYEAVLGEFLGEFKIEEPVGDEQTSHSGIKNEDKCVQKYGLKAFSPIASGFWYEDFDDFGTSRSYGYKRRHLGHDLMIHTGVPVIAAESGIVEALGWNQYGGWRIGIRSFDGKRYYYYAHLRKDRPYAAGLYQGKAVNAGDVIGYTGRTGYSAKENVNNINTSHLHFGMQLIFDESQHEGSSEIWIDVYNICKLLSQNKSKVVKNDDTKEYTRKYSFSEPSYYLRDNTLSVSADSSAPEGSKPIPIIMYHSLLKHSKIRNSFTISPGLFENDLKYLKEHGYTAILMKDLIDYSEKGTPLPEKPVLLTFDDGHYNNYYYAYPLLKEYNMKAVISIIGTFTDTASSLDENNPAYSYLTWKQIKEMSDSGYVEIQNHSNDLHNYDNNRHGAGKRKGEDLSAYKEVLSSDIELLQHKIAKATGHYPATFTYPFGQISKESVQIMKDMGFKATLGCCSGINYIMPNEGNTDQLFSLKRVLRPPDKSSQQFMEDICP